MKRKNESLIENHYLLSEKDIAFLASHQVDYTQSRLSDYLADDPDVSELQPMFKQLVELCDEAVELTVKIRSYDEVPNKNPQEKVSQEIREFSKKLVVVLLIAYFFTIYTQPLLPVTDFQRNIEDLKIVELLGIFAAALIYIIASVAESDSKVNITNVSEKSEYESQRATALASTLQIAYQLGIYVEPKEILGFAHQTSNLAKIAQKRNLYSRLEV